MRPHAYALRWSVWQDGAIAFLIWRHGGKRLEDMEENALLTTKVPPPFCLHAALCLRFGATYFQTAPVDLQRPSCQHATKVLDH